MIGVDLELERRIIARLREHPADCATVPRSTRPDGLIIVTRDGLQVSLHRRIYGIMIRPLRRGERLAPCKDTFACLNPHHRAVYRKFRRNLTHCPNGHPYAGNEMPAGSRARCRTCHEALIARTRKDPERLAPAKRTTCPHGHSLDDAYVSTNRTTGKQSRRCRTCLLDRMRQRKTEREEPT